MIYNRLQRQHETNNPAHDELFRAACAHSNLLAVDQPVDKPAMVQAEAARYGIDGLNQAPYKCAVCLLYFKSSA
jgi:hypothetical protein